MKKRKKIDWWILGPYLTLSMIGLLEVYSASSYRLLQADENTKSLLLRQLIFIFLSWSVIFLARSVKLHYLNSRIRFSLIDFLFSISKNRDIRCHCQWRTTLDLSVWHSIPAF